MKKIIGTSVALAAVMLIAFAGAMYLEKYSYQTGYHDGLVSGTKMGHASGYKAGVADGAMLAKFDERARLHDTAAKASKKVVDNAVDITMKNMVAREPEATIQRLLDTLTPIRDAIQGKRESSNLLPLSNSERTEDRIKFIDWAEKEYGNQPDSQH